MEIAGFTWKQGRAAADSAKAIEKSANMMYDLGSTKENVDAWLRDQSIRKKIGSEEYPLLLHKVRQNKHIPGSHEYIQYAANFAKKANTVHLGSQSGWTLLGSWFSNTMARVFYLKTRMVNGEELNV